MENETQSKRILIDYLGLVLRGFCMGAADVVPGVSGGTMAFILGIYGELIQAIRTINLDTVKLALSFRLKEIFAAVPWQFLSAVLAGIILAIFTLAPGLEWLLENHPVLIWSFFFGLILASIIVVRKYVQIWNIVTILAAGLACIIAFVIVGLTPSETPTTLWLFFFSGAIAICAMILPGISGSFLLVLMGKYQQILAAVNDRDFVVLIVFAMGASIGILTFAQILGWLFKRFRDITMAILIGFMAGSLRAVWPWKRVVSTMIDRPGEVVPAQLAVTLPPELNSEVLFAFGLAMVGFVLVLVLEGFNKREVLS